MIDPGIYTFGYAGHDPAALHAIATEIDALLCDIRWTPFSKIPGWSGKDLQTRFGMQYLHVPAFGNRAHRDGLIEISGPSEGIATVCDCLTVGPVILMCACRRFETCHRATVADLLKGAGLGSSELVLTKQGRAAA
jgi:uncharacterized protein (DUF488 family)